jgi:hypothetical protein
MERMRNAYKILVANPQEKSPLGKHRRTWENNIKMDPGGIGCEVMDLIYLG